MALTEANYRAASKRSGVPIWIIKAMVGQESGGRQGAVSGKGARGVAQLMPATAAGLEHKYHINTRTPYGNLLGGALYLAQQFHTFHKWGLALAAYNVGPNAVREHGGIPPYEETQTYVRNIMHQAGLLKKQYQTQKGPVQPQQPLSAPRSPAATPTLDKGAFALDQLSHIQAGTYSSIDGLEALHQAMQQAAASVKPAAQQPVLDPQKLKVHVQGKATKRELAAVELAKQYLGTPYVWGGTKPGGFDCSGLLQYIWAKKGVNIPRTTYSQWTIGQKVGRKGLRPGDAVFFKGSDSKNGLPGHVGIYIGGGRFIEAPHTGAKVRISKLAGRGDYMGARRYG